MRREIWDLFAPLSPALRWFGREDSPPQSGTVPLWGPRPQPRHTQVTRAGAARHGHSWDRSFLPATSSHLRRIRRRFLGRRLTSLGLIPLFEGPGRMAVLTLLGTGRRDRFVIYAENFQSVWLLDSTKSGGLFVVLASIFKCLVESVALYAHIKHWHDH